ncbi:hypothetical protein [Methylomonas methanica]|uniref:Uncharacterized protein n=1 Tax=Methylomonas methanica (strain DSM 25384 / MC09) TaxID=857087 RepID=F9ZXE1_METMM|nr:hypothetical protein [Methylomonas methanica]AEG00929.1 hypothetical protein Metme_2538 [Methylomonas methanica MC09]
MSYSIWFQSHGRKHRTIVDKLVGNGYSKEQIINYFDFDNMVVSEPTFCVLYADQKKCHDMEGLNCFLCACPLFRFDDSGIDSEHGLPAFSRCEVRSKFGRQAEFGGKIHQDCSACVVPHSRRYAAKHYDENWFSIMSDCDLANRLKGPVTA